MAAMMKQSRVSEGRRRCRLRALAEIDSVKNDKRHFPYIFKNRKTKKDYQVRNVRTITVNTASHWSVPAVHAAETGVDVFFWTLSVMSRLKGMENMHRCEFGALSPPSDECRERSASAASPPADLFVLLRLSPRQSFPIAPAFLRLTL